MLLPTLYVSLLFFVRYQLISKFLHFADNTYYDPNDKTRDRLYKVRPVIDYFNETFKELYTPGQRISIDEQLLLHKGNLHFKQYIPNKRSRFGIKFFSLCDETGYLYSTEVYVGKNNINDGDLENKHLGKTGQVVMRLMEPLLDKGYRLFVDNWYTSFALFKRLADHQTPACGTVRKNRARFPTSFVSKKLKSGECLYVSQDNVLGMRLHDKRDVFFLSTFHTPKSMATSKFNSNGERVFKEKLVMDYNSGMGFVDKNDAITSQHNMVRKCHKWTSKVVFHFIEEALFNAHVLYEMAPNQSLTYTNFKLAYVEAILNSRGGSNHTQHFDGYHYPEKVPMPSRMKRCVYCYKNGIEKRSRYQCDNCHGNPGLCVTPCFKEYHQT
ncbi:MAG: hypothetical protein AAFY76_06160 [Cyanobacteria bacterium J06649_11]